MARITYTYKSYPNCPRATRYSRERERISAVLSGVTGFASLFAVIGFFITTFSLFSDGDFENFFSVLFLTVIVALWDAYMFVLRNNNTECKLKIILLESSYINKEYCKEKAKALKKENRKENIEFLKKYFLYFFLGMFIAISIVGIIQGFVSTSYDATVLLLLSFLALISFGGLLFYTLPVGKKCFQKIFAKQKVPRNNQKQPHTTEENFFCRKCGEKLASDSRFCHKCGTKVIRE